VAVVQYTYAHKQYTEKLGRVWAIPRLYGFYPGICLTTEEKAWENLILLVTASQRGVTYQKGRDVI